ncbi:MAG: hypothetical protein P0Y64_09725 [Candidatus Sphingomonas colombiensis]|nr:hypothetical protein [Sphingomonas sp.]WEK41699.1 MAG: hypothetical protein P0Y64_09725 [Sphingomonas sp.]
MERRRRAILLIAAALLIAGVGERRPLIALNLPGTDSVINAEPGKHATLELGLFGVSVLVRLYNAR